MTEEEIKKIVSATVDDLREKNMLAEDGELAYQFMSLKLREFYKNGTNEKIQRGLQELVQDPYLEIIDMYYRQNQTITAIAVTLGCDRATVSRNKKRLVMSLYNKCYSE